MKKFYSGMLLAAMLLASSCSNDPEPIGPEKENPLLKEIVFQSAQGSYNEIDNEDIGQFQLTFTSAETRLNITLYSEGIAEENDPVIPAGDYISGKATDLKPLVMVTDGNNPSRIGIKGTDGNYADYQNITDGTVKVSATGNAYTFDFTLTTADGTKLDIKTYSSAVTIEDKRITPGPGPEPEAYFKNIYISFRGDEYKIGSTFLRMYLYNGLFDPYQGFYGAEFEVLGLDCFIDLTTFEEFQLPQGTYNFNEDPETFGKVMTLIGEDFHDEGRWGCFYQKKEKDEEDSDVVTYALMSNGDLKVSKEGDKYSIIAKMAGAIINPMTGETTGEILEEAEYDFSGIIDEGSMSNDVAIDYSDTFYDMSVTYFADLFTPKAGMFTLNLQFRAGAQVSFY